MMLVLSRREGEEIQIGDDMVVTVLTIAGGHVRIGIAAPREVPVNRRECVVANETGQRVGDIRNRLFDEHRSRKMINKGK